MFAKNFFSRRIGLGEGWAWTITTVQDWLSRIDKDNKESRDATICSLWLSCHTQEEIASAMGMSQKTIASILLKMEHLRFSVKPGIHTEIEDDEKRWDIGPKFGHFAKALGETFQQLLVKGCFGRSKAVMAPEARFTDKDEIGLPQIRPMPGNAWLWGLQDFHDVSDTQFPTLQDVENPPGDEVDAVPPVASLNPIKLAYTAHLCFIPRQVILHWRHEREVRPIRIRGRLLPKDMASRIGRQPSEFSQIVRSGYHCDPCVVAELRRCPEPERPDNRWLACRR
jgi:hypothetical protein